MLQGAALNGDDRSIAGDREALEDPVAAFERAPLLRFTTAGSVDDGKSTLIGRLLHDCRAVFRDQLLAAEEASRRIGNAETDLALLTDGLRAEREQKITIDVAYRPFATPRRRFIIADAPGHEQYTRNMVTAASTADAAVILLDAQRGITLQSRRHAFVIALIGLRSIAVAVNKMDLVDWSRERYEELRSIYGDYLSTLSLQPVFIPVSALRGDNIVERGSQAPWYSGPSLLEYLETVPIERPDLDGPFRMAVQYVQRPDSTYRGYSGALASGSVRIGDPVGVHPSGRITRVTSILTPRGETDAASAPEAVTLTVADDIDIGRGHLLASPDDPPLELTEFIATVIWMDDAALDTDITYLMKHGTRTLRARATEVLHRICPTTLEPEDARTLEMNDIGKVRIRALQPIYADPYADNRQTGSFILIDPGTHQTAGAGLIEGAAPRRGEATHLVRHQGRVTNAMRQRLFGQKPITLWCTGLSGSGKSTLAAALEETLIAAGNACVVLDGDTLRYGLNRDLGFSPEDRAENIRRAAEVAALFNDSGLIVIASFISPYAADRENARQIIGSERFAEVFVDAPREVCEQRDPKGHYAKARAGLIPEFTGVSAPYEPPLEPDLRLATDRSAVAELTATLMRFLTENGYIAPEVEEDPNAPC